MSEAARQVVLRLPVAVRHFARLSAVAGGVIGGLYGAMAVMSHGAHLLVPVIVVALILVGRPLAMLFGRTIVTADRIIALRPPIRRVTVPFSDIGLLEIRRGVLMEWPVLYLRDGSAVELAAPMRFWFHSDPVFDRDLDELQTRLTGQPVGMRYQWSMPRLIAGPLLTVTAVALVWVDPPWASDAWPLRVHARQLPDVCRMLDARAQRLLPGARIDRLFSRNDDTDPHVKRHTCQWNATHLAPDGATLIGVGRLSVELELDHGIGRTSDATEAHRAFLRETRVGMGETETKLGHTGDEADLIVQHRGTGFAWVTVAARRANVEEKIDLIYSGRSREKEAEAVAAGLARLGLSEIRFRR